MVCAASPRLFDKLTPVRNGSISAKHKRLWRIGALSYYADAVVTEKGLI